MNMHFVEDSAGKPVLDLRAEAREHTVDLSGLPELTGDEITMAARTWRGRMVNEHISAQVFASLVPQLMRAAVPGSLQAEVPQMISDEYRHARMCAGVVASLGHAPIAPLPEIQTVPTHPEVGPLEAVTRNVLSVCCMSETVAVSVIRAEQAELQGTVLGEVLDRILADEVQHARFGWSFLGLMLPRLSQPALDRLGEYLLPALIHQIEFEIPKLPVNAGLRPELAQAGVCDGGFARSLFYDTIGSIVVPQLEAAGLPAQTAWHQAKERAVPFQA
jgi:hypothetical protein